MIPVAIGLRSSVFSCIAVYSIMTFVFISESISYVFLITLLINNIISTSHIIPYSYWNWNEVRNVPLSTHGLYYARSLSDSETNASEFIKNLEEMFHLH